MGLLQFIGSDEYPRALWGSTGAMVATAAKSTKYPEELVIKIAPNDQQAIVTAVNNFEVVAVRCKQAEERADKWFAKACERNALLKLEEARTADLTRQLVELSAVCDAMKAAGCHERKCHNCGFVMFAADGVIPYVTCKRCGSNDTRRQQERSETVDSTCVIENADEAIKYMTIGDLDKPFHLCECACEQCEKWREDKGRPTHRALRAQFVTTKEKGTEGGKA